MLDFREIAAREERRQALRTAEVAQEAEAIAGGSMAFAGVGSWANQAAGLGLDGPVSDADLDRLVSFYVARGVEPRIEVCSYADPSLVEGLAARGFALRLFEHVFVRDLAQPVPAPEHLPPDGLEIRAVDPDDEAQVRTFVDASTIGFRPPGEPVSDITWTVTRRMVRQAGCTCFLALLDGEPAGGGAVDVVGDIAALMGTSVDPRFRRRGIQQALMRRRLAHARAQGAKVAVIGALPGIPTERNARRTGFALAYAKAILAMRGEGLAPSP